MAQIRETIESLCAVLKYNGISELTAEKFRLAKFDNPDTTGPMWLTLKNSLLWLETGNDKTINFDEEKGKLSGELPAIVRYCKHGIFSRGYRARSFFALPDTMESGSREILLAIGWLFAKENCIKKFATRAKRTIYEDLPFKESNCTGILPVGNTLHLSSKSKVTVEENKLLRIIEGIILLKGKLDAASRSLLATKNEYSRLLNRIHVATLSFPQKSQSANNHLSLNDVYILYYEKELIKQQGNLEYENKYLSSLISLMESESLFWKWMESTLDEKLKSKQETSGETIGMQESRRLGSIDYKPSKVMQGIKTQQVEFSRLLQKQESLYMDVSTKWKRWKRYKNAVEESKETHEEFLHVLSCLDQEVDFELKNSLEKDFIEQASDTRAHSHIGMLHSALQGPLKLITPSPHHKKRCNSTKTPTNEPTVIANVTWQLSKKDEVLKQQLLSLKREHNSRMLKYSLTFKDIVCMPPNSK